MLQIIELNFLNLVLDFFGWSADPEKKIAGIIVLAIPTIILAIQQFLKQGKTPIPGLFAFFFGILLYNFWATPERIGRRVQIWMEVLQTPNPYKTPVPLVEPFFHYLVGPYQTRMMYEEMAGLLLVLYIGSFIYHVRVNYKKTGILFDGFSLKSFFTAKHLRPQRSKTNELGSGDLATTEHIARWTKPSTQPDTDTHLWVHGLRGSEGNEFKANKLYFPNEQRNRHMLIVAKTGGGKTTKMMLPILYSDCMSRTRSTIIIDSKPEMWRKLARMTREHNPEKRILRFNPLEPRYSLSWNILAKITDDTDAKLIANTIIMATDPPSGTKTDSPFFRNNALAILNAIMIGLLADRKEGKDTLSMPRIHQLVQSGMRGLCDWLESHEGARRNTMTFIELARSGSQNADTIMSELSMRLSAWDISTIRATTSLEELDLEQLVSHPTLFIVELRESELEMLRPMANVIVVELMRFLTKRAEREEAARLPRPVSIVIDEFASALGRIPDIHVKLNTLRSRNISIVGAIQSTSQVKANYDTYADSVLAGFNTKIFMPPLEQQDAELASKDTGQMTVRFKTASVGTNRKIIEWFASRNISSQEQVQQRAVLTPDEIGRPADNICTFFLPETPVFQGHLIPYYKLPELNKRISAYDSEALELPSRTEELIYDDTFNPVGAASGGATKPGGLPVGITDTRGWSEDKVVTKLEEVKKKLDWDNTTGSARKWWEAFEAENKTRLALVLRLAEELLSRKATITEFFLAYVYSNTDNIQANLHYLDYTRLKKEEERKRRDAAQASQPGGVPATQSGAAA